MFRANQHVGPSLAELRCFAAQASLLLAGSGRLLLQDEEHLFYFSAFPSVTSPVLVQLHLGTLTTPASQCHWKQSGKVCMCVYIRRIQKNLIPHLGTQWIGFRDLERSSNPESARCQRAGAGEGLRPKRTEEQRSMLGGQPQQRPKGQRSLKMAI